MSQHSATVQRGGKKKRKRPARIVVQPLPGIDESAPYWRGHRAEKIVARRVKSYETTRRARRSSRSGSAPRLKTPHQQLSRLQRALSRRKTLAGRQSVQSKIDLLLKEIDR